MTVPIIPLARHLSMGMKGRDVTAVQYALRHAGVREGKPTGRYGKATKHQVGEFKRHAGIKDENGYGTHTHKHLWPEFGIRARRLYREAANNIGKSQVVHDVVAAGMLGYEERAYIHYTQGPDRMKDFAPPPNVPNDTDCSAFDTWCYKSGGAPDPNGFGYNGYGFTGTMLEHGTQIATPVVGCLVFYGHPVSHVALYIGNGRVISHGSEAGPLLLDVHYRSDFNQYRRYF